MSLAADQGQDSPVRPAVKPSVACASVRAGAAPGATPLPAVEIEVIAFALAASGEEEVLGRATVTMLLERLPNGGTRIPGITDFTREWIKSVATAGRPLNLRLLLNRAGNAPRRLTSPAGLGRC